MSLAIAEPMPQRAGADPGELPAGISTRAVALSAALHVVLGALLIIGLPRLFSPPQPEELPTTVQLVTIAPETRATRPNLNPRPEAKPELPDVEPPAARPEPKPEPPKPAPVPPPAAAAPPAPEAAKPPEPKPAPPVAAKPPEPKPEPPVAAKPPEPKPAPPVAAKPPEPKPAPPVAAKPPEPKPEPPVAAKPPADLVEPPPRPKEKPEPPSRTGKSEPKPEPRKYDPTQFQALLRNLAAQQAAPAPDAPPQKPRAASARASSQPKAPLASQLTANELDMVRHQIAQCWNVPAGARDARDLVVEIRVAVDPDGAVRQATIVDQGRLSDPFFRAAAESARRAFFNPQCRPLHLPPGKYAIWKDLVVDFSPKDML